MIITSFSLYMAVIWSSLFIVLIYFFRKKIFSINFISVSGIALIYLFCVVRMAFPFEMPYVTIIQERELYNRLTLLMNQDVGIGNFQCRFSTLMLGVWLITAVILSTHFISIYYKYKSIMIQNSCKKVTDERLKGIINKVCTQKKKHEKIEVLIGESIKTPMSIGIFKQYVLLPEKEYGNDELFYILLHEYTHLWNGDPAVKLLIRILQCVFWWNPFIYLLQQDLEQILEIKCDLTVIKKLGINKKKSYLTTIITTIEAADCCFAKSSIDIEERFRIVSRYENIKGERIKKNLLYVLAIIMLCLSYSFVIQSEFSVPLEDIESGYGYYKLEMPESYISKDGDGNYWLILPGQEKAAIDEATAIKMEGENFQIKKQGGGN